MGAHLLEQVSPLLGRQRLDQLLLGRGQDALEADDEEFADQVGVDLLGTPAHVFLLEIAHPLADGGFDLSLRLHGFSRASRCRSSAPEPTDDHVELATEPGSSTTNSSCGHDHTKNE